jgi:hypothetical protein
MKTERFERFTKNETRECVRTLRILDRAIVLELGGTRGNEATDRWRRDGSSTGAITEYRIVGYRYATCWTTSAEADLGNPSSIALRYLSLSLRP